MTMLGRPPQEARLRDVLLVLVAAFGLAACVTLIWLGMRAVMDIGGACAEGGATRIAVKSTSAIARLSRCDVRRRH